MTRVHVVPLFLLASACPRVGSSMGADAGPTSCDPSFMQMCGDACLPYTDPNNCGSCGVACSSDRTCAAEPFVHFAFRCYCNAPFVDCSGTCFDPSSSCESPCAGPCAQGLSCFDKQCRTTLFKGLHDVSGLAFHDGWLYWTDTDAGELWRGAPDGGARSLVASQLGTPRLLTPSAGDLYLADDVRLVRVPLDGGASVSVATLGAPISAIAIASSGVSVAAGGLVSLIPWDGGEQPIGGIANQTVPDLFAEGDDLYWASEDYSAFKFSVLHASDAGVSLLHVALNTCCGRFGLTPSHYYWSDGLDFLRVPRDGGINMDIVGGRPYSQILTDDAGVAYVNGLTLLILRANGTTAQDDVGEYHTTEPPRPLATDGQQIFYSATTQNEDAWWISSVSW